MPVADGGATGALRPRRPCRRRGGAAGRDSVPTTAWALPDVLDVLWGGVPPTSRRPRLPPFTRRWWRRQWRRRRHRRPRRGRRRRHRRPTAPQGWPVRPWRCTRRPLPSTAAMATVASHDRHARCPRSARPILPVAGPYLPNARLNSHPCSALEERPNATLLEKKHMKRAPQPLPIDVAKSLEFPCSRPPPPAYLP